MPAPQEVAWTAGYAVGKRGKPATMCPYAKGALLAAWHEGWQNGASKRDASETGVTPARRLHRR